MMKNPEMFLKAKGHAIPAPLPPDPPTQMCEVMLALHNDTEMQFVKSRCDIMNYECKVTTECPWLGGTHEDSE